MIYILDVELPENKILPLALKSIYGLGARNSKIYCKKLGFSKNLTVKALSVEQLRELGKYIEYANPLISNDLLKTRLLLAEKLVSIKLYRGLRKNQGLPARGQRTHTNAKTSRKKLY
jgi:small subunit ribosomal protein S13